MRTGISIILKPADRRRLGTQPGLPMKKGRAGTMTHDYKRHGTTTLFAALDVLEGKVIGRCMQRHRPRIHSLPQYDRGAGVGQKTCTKRGMARLMADCAIDKIRDRFGWGGSDTGRSRWLPNLSPTNFAKSPKRIFSYPRQAP
jgi:hypothetical protein